MPGHYNDKKKKRAPSARPTKSKGPFMEGVKASMKYGTPSGIGAQAGKGAKAMAMKTMALLKKKKKK